jgi:hypothetical protein
MVKSKFDQLRIGYLSRVHYKRPIIDSIRLHLDPFPENSVLGSKNFRHSGSLGLWHRVFRIVTIIARNDAIMPGTLPLLLGSSHYGQNRKSGFRNVGIMVSGTLALWCDNFDQSLTCSTRRCEHIRPFIFSI